MAASLDRYPVAGSPIVRGDPLAISVTIDPTLDITGWNWVASAREVPDSPYPLVLDVSAGVAPNELILTLSGAQTASLADGWGLDLAQTTPIVRTWLIIHSLDVEKDYSHG